MINCPLAEIRIPQKIPSAGLGFRYAKNQCLPPDDDIRDGNNGIPHNGTTFATGMVDQAFLLDGIDDFVDVGNAPNLRVSPGEFTVDAWVNFNALRHSPDANNGGLPGDIAILDKMSPSGVNTDGWRLIKQDNDLFWFCFGGGAVNGCDPSSPNTVMSTTSATTGTWFHIAAVKSAAEIAIYVNGVNEASKPTPTFTDTHSANLLIGANALEGAHLNGLIDEVEIFNRALSQPEIQSIVDAGSAGKCKPTPITLSAGKRKVGGINTVRLTWSGATSANIDIYRNDVVVVTTANDGSHIDSTGDTGRARYRYQVCEAGTSTCSNNVRVMFPP